jgi:hypothetical protein
VCYGRHSRLHISLADRLISELDRRAGRGRRSTFISHTLERALDDERRWEEIEASLGVLADAGHEWDADPVAWVRAGRREDPRLAG